MVRINYAARGVVNRVIFFADGEIAEQGSAPDIFDHQNNRTKQFLSAIARTTKKVRRRNYDDYSNDINLTLWFASHTNISSIYYQFHF